MNDKVELFKWYKRPDNLGGDYFFVFRQRPPWEYDLIRYNPKENSWNKENLGFIYKSDLHKIKIPQKSLQHLIKGLFFWTWLE